MNIMANFEFRNPSAARFPVPVQYPICLLPPALLAFPPIKRSMHSHVITLAAHVGYPQAADPINSFLAIPVVWKCLH